ncbi:MAG: hypothetical protein QOF96_1673, partial [Actinomycetota bacterium]|nr:hypothetical protein [Actinomycetota bacterium]
MAVKIDDQRMGLGHGGRAGGSGSQGRSRGRGVTQDALD